MANISIGDNRTDISINDNRSNSNYDRGVTSVSDFIEKVSEMLKNIDPSKETIFF